MTWWFYLNISCARFLFWRIFFTRTGIHPRIKKSGAGLSLGRLSLANALSGVRDFLQRRGGDLQIVDETLIFADLGILIRHP